METKSHRFCVPRVLEIVVVGAATIGSTMACAGTPAALDASIGDGANADTATADVAKSDTATADASECLCNGMCRPEGGVVVCVQADGRSCSLPASQCALA